MQIFRDLLISNLDDFQKQLSILLREYSRLKRWNDPGSGFYFIGGDYSFEKLSDKGAALQHNLLIQFQKLKEVLTVFVSKGTDKRRTNVKNALIQISDYIEQDKSTYKTNIDEVIADLNIQTGAIIECLNQIFPVSELAPLLIVDTNSLYANPDIEKWEFPQINKFTVCITPQVLSELDNHKNDHRNENVREKAIKLINKMKEYAEGGKLTDGVTIVKDKISLISIAVEPKFDSTLSWLDETNGDDRIIASTIEIVLEHAYKPVFIVTNDINLQNKCDYANIPFLESPKVK